MDDHVVNVRSSVGLIGPHDDIHQMLEGRWHPMEAKWENLVLPMASGGTEGSFRPGGRAENNLPVAFIEV